MCFFQLLYMYVWCMLYMYVWVLSYILLLRGKSKSINSFVSKGLYFYAFVKFMLYIWIYSVIIKMSGNIEVNPGPKPSSCNKFSIYDWNLNNIFAHNFVKLSLLRGYISVHNFNTLYLSKTYLDSTISRRGIPADDF